MDDAERMKRLEGLLAIDERITALEASRGDRRPWWRNAGLIAAYAGLLTLVPTAITGLSGWLETRRQVELAAQQQDHERTLAYLGLAVDPESTEAARLQVLRFLASRDGDPVATWATAELALVQTKIASLVDEQQEMVAEVKVVDAKAKAAQTEAAGLQAQAQNDPKLAKEAASKSAEADHLVADVLRKRDRIDAISTRLGEAPLEILQLRAVGRVQAKEASRAADLEANAASLRLTPMRTIPN
jgi:hypothetical protein